jgi:hypothetical protein
LWVVNLFIALVGDKLKNLLNRSVDQDFAADFCHSASHPPGAVPIQMKCVAQPSMSGRDGGRTNRGVQRLQEARLIWQERLDGDPANQEAARDHSKLL